MRTPPRPGRRRGLLVAASAVLVAGLLAFHAAVPNTAAHLGSLLETFLPWLGLSIPVLAGLALWRRPAVSLPAVLLALLAWLGLFGGHLLPDRDRASDVTAVQHNVSDENADPAATVRGLLEVRPDLVALEELTPAALPAYAAAFPPEYPHHTVQGTVGLWSRYPLTGAAPVDIRPRAFGTDWNRGLRATARTPHGDVAVYVAHLPSVRLGLTGFDCARRDESAALLGARIAAEPLDRVLLLGDLNNTVHDRGLEPIAALMSTAESDFAFSWPAGYPVARIDQIMGRSLTVTEVWALPATGSDHLPIAARISFQGS
ncbi:endonuclease/exonuclease/phosphatase family protein [Amorphoplanes digitatis]|uniref:Vancomycin resistance protein VanJ n=1 Tax=Actinoplanes digitatis TaxID=1868 RepID=A0A7W7HXB1_9ACTN|nr:endonuclease/exonuclease/phosphatase family protein [Actinoplanes digitatis]MBB4762477.1 vancomycin resistance protein VanJ [Actinoplanes digitatis]